MLGAKSVAIPLQGEVSEAHRRKMASRSPRQLAALVKPTKMMARLDGADGPLIPVFSRKPPLPVKMAPYRRRGLLTLREKRIRQVETLSLLQVRERQKSRLSLGTLPLQHA